MPQPVLPAATEPVEDPSLLIEYVI
jgi:hypothetical protein